MVYDEVNGYTTVIPHQREEIFRAIVKWLHDGDHSHPYVANEIRAWAPKLKESGWHIGDDHNWDTVRDSVQEVFNMDYTVTGKDVWRASKYLG